MINLDINNNRQKMLDEISINYQIIEGFRKNDSEFDIPFLLKLTKALENKYFKNGK